MQRRRATNTAERVLPDIGPAGGVITPVRPEVGDFGPGRVPGGGSDQTERNALARNLEEMAGTLEELDPRSSERMRSLARAVATDEGRQRWAEVDLRRAFNTERLAYVYALEREGGYAHSTIATADRVRNILVLAPILLTWFALAMASRDYDAFLALNPDEVRQPFLVLWERGFGGTSSWYAPSFSTVALIDAVLIAIIIGLTFYSHGRREAREEKVDQTAEHFQADLDNVLAEASVALAMDRGSRPALLARGVERLVDRFEQNSQELLTRLRVEHDRLEQLATRREREFADFGVFASGMRAGAEETHRLLVELRQVSSGLQTALEDLTSEVSSSVDQGRSPICKATRRLPGRSPRPRRRWSKQRTRVSPGRTPRRRLPAWRPTRCAASAPSPRTWPPARPGSSAPWPRKPRRTAVWPTPCTAARAAWRPAPARWARSRAA
jgi:hypothetical protein